MAVDATLFVLLVLLIQEKAFNMITILEIIADTSSPEEHLLVLCPSWTMEKIEGLNHLSAMSWGALCILSASAVPVLASSFSFWLSVAAGAGGGGCPQTPTTVTHRLFVFSLWFSGTALLFTGSSFTFEWKGDGSVFHGPTDPRAFKGLYYETSCFGYGGCSGGYLNVVAEHDDWCPTGYSILSAHAETLTLIGGILFGVTFPILMGGTIYSFCAEKGPHFRRMIAIPSILAAAFGLVVGGINYPLLLPYIFAHALWQYVRIPINRIIGVDQAAVDTSFRTKPTDDMVPGIIGAVAAGGDSSGPGNPEMVLLLGSWPSQKPS